MIQEMLVENSNYVYLSDKWIKMLCFIDENGIFYPYFNREVMTDEFFASRVKAYDIMADENFC